jgi:proteasome accessory factor B
MARSCPSRAPGAEGVVVCHALPTRFWEGIVQRSERLMKLLEFLHSQPGLEAEALAKACGGSTRTLQRDLDALGAAGFPVYFERGYRLAVPTLLPAITLTAEQALALRLAADAAAQRSEPATAETLAVAARKLALALAAQPAERLAQRQLALPVSDPRAEARAAALAEAIADLRTVRLTVTSGSGREAASRRVDPYRLLPASEGVELLGYCHERRRIVRLPVARVQDVAVLRRRFRPLPARLVERHLHASRAVAPELHWVRVLCRPPLVQNLRRYPPVGSLTWEHGPEGSVIYTLAVQRPADLLPWLLSCGESVEVLQPPDLRHEVLRIARAVTAHHTAAPTPATPVD